MTVPIGEPIGLLLALTYSIGQAADSIGIILNDIEIAPLLNGFNTGTLGQPSHNSTIQGYDSSTLNQTDGNAILENEVT